MIDGVDFIPLYPNVDSRGSLTTIYLKEEADQCLLPQWNLVRSEGMVLRGMHAHLYYDEYYVPVSGRVFIALADLRPGSATYKNTMVIKWDMSERAIMIPKGVLHGVFCEEPYVLAYGLSSPFTGEGEFTCRWDDIELGIDWPVNNPMLSDRDRHSGSYAEVLMRYREALAQV